MEECRDERPDYGQENEEGDKKDDQNSHRIISLIAMAPLFILIIWQIIKEVGGDLNHYFFSIIICIASIVLAAVVLSLLQSNQGIEALERSICRRLDNQGYQHEKVEGALFVTKNDHHFRVHFADSCNKGIKRLFFLYEFADDNFGKVSKEGWARVANYINLDNTRVTFVAFEDHCCCCYQSAIGTSKDFMKEFDLAYQAVGAAMYDYNRLYPYIELDYPNKVSDDKNSIGFKSPGD